MTFAYSKNGLSFRAVDADYVAQDGEVVFTDYATPAELATAFANYSNAIKPSIEQLAQSAINQGIQISCTSNPALNAIYGCDPTSVSYIMAEMIAILTFQTFTNGSTELTYADLSGTSHTFPTTATFQAFGSAVGKYLGAVTAFANGQTTSLPSNQVTIS